MPEWKQFYVRRLAFRYGFKDGYYDGLKLPTSDGSGAVPVGESSNRVFNVYSNEFRTLWLTDGMVFLPQDYASAHCSLINYTFAFQVHYSWRATRRGWEWVKDTGLFLTSGEVDVLRLRVALKLFRQCKEPLGIEDMEVFSSFLLKGSAEPMRPSRAFGV